MTDPACGTGGFLLSVHTYLAAHFKLNQDQKRHLRYDALRGVELVDGVARLCAMNLFLHGIGPDDPHVLAAEIAEDLRSALEQIESVLGDSEELACVVKGELATETRE